MMHVQLFNVRPDLDNTLSLFLSTRVVGKVHRLTKPAVVCILVHLYVFYSTNLCVHLHVLGKIATLFKSCKSIFIHPPKCLISK